MDTAKTETPRTEAFWKRIVRDDKVRWRLLVEAKRNPCRGRIIEDTMVWFDAKGRRCGRPEQLYLRRVAAVLLWLGRAIGDDIHRRFVLGADDQILDPHVRSILLSFFFRLFVRSFLSGDCSILELVRSRSYHWTILLAESGGME
jgi:hypothetical protein